MKIENILFNSVIFNNEEKSLKEGTIVKGEIIELIDKKVLIDIEGLGILHARSDMDLNLHKGDNISFVIKSFNDREIYLKPIIEGDLEKVNIPTESKYNDPISKILNNIGIKKTKLSIEFANQLMKYNIPMTEENLILGIRTLEKLTQITNVTDEEKIVLIDPSKIFDSIKLDKVQDIKSKLPTNIDFNTKNILLIDENDSKETLSPEKIDIKYFMVTNKEDNKELRDLSQLVKSYLVNEPNIEDEYIKIIGFLLKNDIKPSLNNISKLMELNKSPMEFAEDFKKIDKLLDKTQISVINEFVQDKENSLIHNIISSESEKLHELQKLINDFRNTAPKDVKEEFRELENKIEFLRELNKDLSFLFLPIYFDKEELKAVLTFIMESKKKKSYNNKINVFININTHHLGNVEVSCQLVANTLQVKMNIRKQDLELFKSAEKQLIEKILSIGYSLDKIDFKVDDYIQIIDTMVSNPNPTYFLDLKV